MKVALPDGKQVEYLIDAKQRRIGKKVGGKLTKGWLYKDPFNPIVELDDQGQVVGRFVYADKGFVPAYLIKDGRTYRIISDHLGSVRLVVNADSGEIVQRLDYDAFGNVLQDTNPGFQPFGFAGGLYDPDTKLVRFGARDYDSEIGRWTTKEPLRFAGSLNFYAYVNNNPINYIDPLGLYGFEDYVNDLPDAVVNAPRPNIINQNTTPEEQAINIIKDILMYPISENIIKPLFPPLPTFSPWTPSIINISPSQITVNLSCKF